MWTRRVRGEAKRGYVRALRLLIAICMVVAGVAGFLFFAFHGFRLSEPQSEIWIGFGLAALCWLALFGFRKWLDLDEQGIMSS